MKNLIYPYIPESVIRFVIKRLLAQRLRECQQTLKANINFNQEFIQNLKASPIALSTDKANEQHYEIPTAFYQYMLGPHMKYSCAYWDDETAHLADAEKKMLALYCKRLQIKDGEAILDLGCGWGSASLYIAKHYPHCQVTSLSNSATQGEYILTQAKKLGLSNISFVKENANQIQLNQKFDKIISIEMFEHMRNYQQLLKKLHGLLNPQGLLFVHYFCHKEYIYPYSTNDNNSWMAKHFFTDGLMPCQNLLDHFQEDFEVKNSWKINGCHYDKTCEAWLANLETNKAAIVQLFAETLNESEAKCMWKNWQIFVLACAELFKKNQGNEWFVCHQLLQAR